MSIRVSLRVHQIWLINVWDSASSIDKVFPSTSKESFITMVLSHQPPWNYFWPLAFPIWGHQSIIVCGRNWCEEDLLSSSVGSSPISTSGRDFSVSWGSSYVSPSKNVGFGKARPVVVSFGKGKRINIIVKKMQIFEISNNYTNQIEIGIAVYKVKMSYWQRHEEMGACCNFQPSCYHGPWQQCNLQLSE